MKNFYYLNLPKVPAEVADAVIDLCQNVKICPDRYNRATSRFQYNMPILAQEYGTENTPVPDHIINDLNEIYRNFFPGGFKVFYGVAKNISNGLAITPPHTDRLRRVAINYLLRTGGENVLTTFYHEKNHHDANLSASCYLPYDALTVEFRTKIQEKTWHCFDAQHFHSVENVETERFYLSLVLDQNENFDNFVVRYANLLVEDLGNRLS